MYECMICNEITSDVCKRYQFDDELMCDICYSESCYNAMNSGNGDSMIDIGSFNEIRNTNSRR